MTDFSEKFENALFHTDSKRKYDPIKRREYYLKTRQLKGRKKSKSTLDRDIKNREKDTDVKGWQQENSQKKERARSKDVKKMGSDRELRQVGTKKMLAIQQAKMRYIEALEKLESQGKKNTRDYQMIRDRVLELQFEEYEEARKMGLPNALNI